MAAIKSLRLHDLWRSRPWADPERLLFWLALTFLLHGVLTQVVGWTMGAVDRLLTMRQCWSALVWLSFVEGVAIGLVPALLTGLVIARFRRAYRPSLTVPLGVACYWFAEWAFDSNRALPWFLLYSCFALPVVLLWAWIARWATRRAARATYLDPESPATPDPPAGVAHGETRQKWAWIMLVVAWGLDGLAQPLLAALLAGSLLLYAAAVRRR